MYRALWLTCSVSNPSTLISMDLLITIDIRVISMVLSNCLPRQPCVSVSVCARGGGGGGGGEGGEGGSSYRGVSMCLGIWFMKHHVFTP